MTSRKEISSVLGTWVSQPGQEEQCRSSLLHSNLLPVVRAALLQPGIYLKVKAHWSWKLWAGLCSWIWLKGFWVAVPAKPSPSFFGKLLQGLHRLWTFLFGLYGALTEAQGVSPQRPREVDKSRNGEGQGYTNLLQTAPCSLSNQSGDSLNCPCLIPSLCD